ncbi:P-loop containing nucleoside triphosphate hydrolase protein [Serendipita vermifera]|nr:P-loop containing nucleoside triphosphate hydrolase protein [Serendipita vermifera]
MSSHGANFYGLEDVFIILLGLTGSGKTTFIKHLTGREDLETDPMEPCTKEIQPYSVTIGGQEVTLVDTPGLQAERNHDNEIISGLQKLCQTRSPAFICCHSIRDPKIDRTTRDCFRVMQQVCGRPANVAIVTTHWDPPGTRAHQMQLRRQKQLREGKLKDWIKGNEVYQTDDTPAIARLITCSLLENEVRMRKIRQDIRKERAKGRSHEKAVQIVKKRCERRRKASGTPKEERLKIEAELKILESYGVSSKRPWILTFFSFGSMQPTTAG